MDSNPPVLVGIRRHIEVLEAERLVAPLDETMQLFYEWLLFREVQLLAREGAGATTRWSSLGPGTNLRGPGLLWRARVRGGPEADGDS